MQKKKNNIKRTVVRIVLFAVLGAIIGLQAYSLNAESLVGNSMPMPFGVGASVVLSGSMEPELSVDDLIIVRERDDYDIGDVVVYQSHGELIVHRIIAADEETVTTQGDANDTADEPINRSDIKGEVVYSVANVGAVIGFVKSPVVMIGLIAAAILMMEMSFRREKKRDDEDLDRIKEEIRRLQASMEAQPSEADAEDGEQQ